MITVANRIYVTPEYAEAFEERFRQRAGLVDGMPGFISNQVLRPVNDGDPYVVFKVSPAAGAASIASLWIIKVHFSILSLTSS